MNEAERQRNRADVRRVLRYIRTMSRLKEACPIPRYDVLVRAAPDKPEIVGGPRWAEVQNLLARFRPIYLDGEEISFRRMVKLLPRHVRISGGPDCDALEKRWDEILQGETAPLPEGTRLISVTGDFEMVWPEEGTLEIGFDSMKLTGKEAIDLTLYGELVHVDAAKERKLLRIAGSFVSDGYRLAVMSLTAELVRLADTVRTYAEEFVKVLGPEKIREIESEHEQPPTPDAESR